LNPQKKSDIHIPFPTLHFKPNKRPVKVFQELLLAISVTYYLFEFNKLQFCAAIPGGFEKTFNPLGLGVCPACFSDCRKIASAPSAGQCQY
jgi:hypothetical protein